MDITDNRENISAADFLTSDADKKKERKKSHAKQYKFSDKKNSRGGIASSIMALLSLAGIIAAVVIATVANGSGGSIVGYLGGVAFVLSFAGIVTGLLSFRRTDVFYKFAWIGLIANVLIWLFITCIIVIAS